MLFNFHQKLIRNSSNTFDEFTILIFSKIEFKIKQILFFILDLISYVEFFLWFCHVQFCRIDNKKYNSWKKYSYNPNIKNNNPLFLMKKINLFQMNKYLKKSAIDIVMRYILHSIFCALYNFFSLMLVLSA